MGGKALIASTRLFQLAGAAQKSRVPLERRVLGCDAPDIGETFCSHARCQFLRDAN